MYTDCTPRYDGKQEESYLPWGHYIHVFVLAIMRSCKKYWIWDQTMNVNPSKYIAVFEIIIIIFFNADRATNSNLIDTGFLCFFAGFLEDLPYKDQPGMHLQQFTSRHLYFSTYPKQPRKVIIISWIAH